MPEITSPNSNTNRDGTICDARRKIHQGVGHASMAEEIPFVARSMEHEGIVGKLHNRQFLCVHQVSPKLVLRI
jgi:hypothetical protein